MYLFPRLYTHINELLLKLYLDKILDSYLCPVIILRYCFYFVIEMLQINIT